VTATGDGTTDDEAARRRQALIIAAAMESRLHQNAYDQFEDAAAAYFGVNRTAMRCMDVLDRVGQLTPGEIAVQTGLTSGAVTAMLDRLERQGLVRRLPDPSDRRRVLVELTDEAKQVAAEIYEPLVGEMAQFERYTDDELRLITDFTRLATQTLRRHADRVEQQPGRGQRQAAQARRDAARADREAARQLREAGKAGRDARTERQAGQTERDAARAERQRSRGRNGDDG
jgi:DNA-binding MarR family transcriptional regulator